MARRMEECAIGALGEWVREGLWPCQGSFALVRLSPVGLRRRFNKYESQIFCNAPWCTSPSFQFLDTRFSHKLWTSPPCTPSLHTLPHYSSTPIYLSCKPDPQISNSPLSQCPSLHLNKLSGPPTNPNRYERYIENCSRTAFWGMAPWIIPFPYFTSSTVDFYIHPGSI